MSKDIDQEINDTMEFISGKSTPDLMSKDEAKEYYEGVVSDLKMLIESLEE